MHKRVSSTSRALSVSRRLVREVYGRRRGSVDPVFLVRRLGALGAALGEDFTDGGQHDCEEVLSAIIDRLHEDLVSPPCTSHCRIWSRLLLEGSAQHARCVSDDSALHAHTHVQHA